MKGTTLDHRTPGKAQEELEAMFHEFIVGQDRAIRRLSRRVLFANGMGGRLRDKTKPAGSFFYLGPTGVGKTRLVEVFAYLLFGRFDAMLKIDCSELKQSHEMSRLIGAPPGYLGHNREPKLSQRRLDYSGFTSQQRDNSELKIEIETIQERLNELEVTREHLKHTQQAPARHMSPEEREMNIEIGKLRKLHSKLAKQAAYEPGAYPAILLFDEIEKAHPDLFDLLLQVHNKAKLTTHEMRQDGNNEVLFHNTFIFYTSNIAQRQLKELIRNSGIGFASPKTDDNKLDDTIWKTALGQLEKKFSPEFIGRIGKENIVVFSHLTREQVRESLDRVLIPEFIKRFTGSFPVTITITDAAKDHLVDESFDVKNRAFGMRALEGAFRRNVEEVLAGLITKSEEEGGIIPGDAILIDFKDGQLLFSARQRTEEQNNSQGSVARINQNLAEEDYFDNRVVVTFRIKKP